MTGTASALTAPQDRLNGSVTFDHRKGTSPVLTKIEATQANKFVDWLIELAKRGFGLSKGAFLTALEKKRASMSKTHLRML